MFLPNLHCVQLQHPARSNQANCTNGHFHLEASATGAKLPTPIGSISTMMFQKLPNNQQKGQSGDSCNDKSIVLRSCSKLCRPMWAFVAPLTSTQPWRKRFMQGGRSIRKMSKARNTKLVYSKGWLRSWNKKRAKRRGSRCWRWRREKLALTWGSRCFLPWSTAKKGAQHNFRGNQFAPSFISSWYGSELCLLLRQIVMLTQVAIDSYSNKASPATVNSDGNAFQVKQIIQMFWKLR